MVHSNAVENSTQRFSTRVANYVKYRPGYSSVLIDFLKAECHLAPRCLVADVGSGTGQLAERFLKNGNRVYGIEPNQEMREAAEFLLKRYSRFRSVAGSAESTTLVSSSVDFVAVGRALHWFDFETALSEFSRILKPEGWLVIVWLKRKTTSPFLSGYEQLLLTYGIDHKEKKQRQADMEGLLLANGYQRRALQGSWTFDFDGLRGQTLSYSVCPEIGHPSCGPMLGELYALFQKYQERGRVSIDYETLIYYKQPRVTSGPAVSLLFEG